MGKVYLASAMLLGLALAATTAQAAIKVETVEYKQGGAVFEGWLVYDDAISGKRPGIVVYPAYWGPSSHERDVAEHLAGMGYVAFVADIYGKGIRPDTIETAAAEASKYIKNRPLLLARAQAALDQLRKVDRVDSNKLGAIGYCFGGAPALDMARSGAPLVDVVTFHGELSTPTPENAKNIKGHVLVLHGAADPIVTKQAVDAFEKEMANAGVDWQVVLYGPHVVHAFTDNVHGLGRGAAYDALADKRSWEAMINLLKGTL